MVNSWNGRKAKKPGETWVKLHGRLAKWSKRNKKPRYSQEKSRYKRSRQEYDYQEGDFEHYG